MSNYENLEFHPTAEKIVNILCQKTGNSNPTFFRVSTNYHLTKLAAMMRIKIATKDRGIIPTNVYAINLAPSGQGKGHSTSIIEDELTKKFRTIFMDQTYPLVVDENLAKLALRRATIENEDPDMMMEAVKREYKDLGNMSFVFDSATTPAVKQYRQKLLMAKIGSMNLEMDEMGNNFLGNADVLSTFLELYDIGKVKNKLTKNTRDNFRNEEIEGRTPANMLLFGAPAAILDGSKTEDEFYKSLEIGYARRCFFGYTRKVIKDKTKTAKQIFADLVKTNSSGTLIKIANKLGDLANIVNYNKIIAMSDPVSIQLIDYKIHCEDLADAMGEHEEIARAEMSHRYFKALKLAGTYAFIDGHAEITKDNLNAAICMAEDSGKAFQKILTRDRNYVKLAKYVSGINHEVTHVDLTEDLPFYKGSQSQKQDLMQLAVAWGYKHHIVIKRTISNGIEFISGETLQETDLNSLTLAYSPHISDGYKNVQSPFDKLHHLVQKPMDNWINHHSDNGHRHEDNIVPGFDLVVLDIDGGVFIQTAMALLKDYKFLLYTTKRHTAQAHRFRMILPLNYHLELAREDFKYFMANIFEWLPFDVDTGAGQRSRKWLTYKGQYAYNKGKQLLDAQLFIPKTAKNNERREVIQTYQSLTNLERWFVQNSTSGNRNNQLLKYAMMLVDMGYAEVQIYENVKAMNAKLTNKLSKSEIDATIMRTVNSALGKRAA